MPDSAEKVSQAVNLFVQNDCPFAIKGGGHSAIPGAANIHEGILMPMQKMDSIDINFEDETVVVGAGALGGAIYAALDAHNLTAMLGRYAKVGLGLSVGAGFSYLCNKEGLVIDNVLNYEVVLANGTIVNANASSNPDLFKALKGGNHNFGVVTALTLRTVKTEGAIYGGIMYYPESSLDQVSDIIYDYHVRQAVEDPLTHALPQYGYNGTTNTSISFNPLAYNANVDKLPAIMQGWLDIPYYEDTLHNRQYYDLSVELNNGFPDQQV
jgi:FAD/FMN-containing dehydrogenase